MYTNFQAKKVTIEFSTEEISELYHATKDQIERNVKDHVESSIDDRTLKNLRNEFHRLLGQMKY